MPRKEARRRALVSADPAHVTVPASGESRPARRLRRVDLPEPDSPRILMLSPEPMSKSTPTSTSSLVSPLGKLLRSPRAVRTGSLTAERLHRLEAGRLPGREQAGQRGDDDGQDHDERDRRARGVGGKLAELVEAPQDLLALGHLHDPEDDVVADGEGREPKRDAGRGPEEADDQSLRAKAGRDLGRPAAERPEKADLARLADD